MLGFWQPLGDSPAFSPRDLIKAVSRFRETAFVLRDDQGNVGVGFEGQLSAQKTAESPYCCLAILPPLYPEWMGDRGFCESYRCRFPYMTGAMAKGIASEKLVCAAAEAGLLASFGAGGLSLDRVDRALSTIESRLQGRVFASNFMHSPHDLSFERALADLYLKHRVPAVELAAFIEITPAVAYLSAKRFAPEGQKFRLMAKISRPEVARRFLQPVPQALLQDLWSQGAITKDEAERAAQNPVVDDLTAEADSGGHTDRQSFSALLPSILELRDRMAPRVRVGAAGGISTPRAVAAAFAMGAAYVVTGSVNVGAVESGLHESAKALLAQADLSDVATAPAADMFELGAEVQVLKRGTLFAQRARRLGAIYREYPSLEALPAAELQRLEREIFRQSLDEAWKQTAEYWQRRDPGELEQAQRDPRHQMALLFRGYLGLASQWAIDGTPERKLDRQIWCGSGIGAFNAWVQGSFLEPQEARTVSSIALNLMEGAACIARAQQLRTAGAPMPGSAFQFTPRPLA